VRFGLVLSCSMSMRRIAPVQRRHAVRWNRLLADRFLVAFSEALESV